MGNALEIAAALLLAAVMPAGAAEVPRTDGITCDRYPDADTVVVDDDDFTEYAPDGTYVAESTTWTKALTEKGRREAGRIVVHYNARYGTAEVLSVSVLGTNGVLRPVDVAATTRDAADKPDEGANIYDPMDRTVVCTVPGLAVGETVCRRVRRVESKPRVAGHFADVGVMEWDSPIARCSMRVKAPASRPLARAAVRNPLGNVAAATNVLADGSILYSWTATNSPQCFPEPDMPPLHTQVQGVLVSTHESWEQVSKWYWELCRPHLAKADAAVTNKVEELVRAAGGGRADAMRAIYRFVAQEVRYMGLTMEDDSPGYAPHDVDVTFGNRYGVCRDKAALLAAMLRIAGIEAYPVLIHAGAKMDDAVPLPFFNHAIVAAVPDWPGEDVCEGYVLMDPTDESSRDLMPAYLGNRSFLVAREGGDRLRTTPSPSAARNAVRISDSGTLERDGALVVESKVSFGGINDNAYRGALLGRRRDQRRRLFERIVSAAAPGAELLQCEILPEDLQDTSRPLEVRLLARYPEALIRGETRISAAVPMLSRSMGFANWILEGCTSLESRRFPLLVMSTAMVEEDARLRLGDAVGDAVSLPGGESSEGAYGFGLEAAFSNGVLSVRRRLAVNSVEFSPGEYQELREAIKRAEACERRPLLFARDRVAGADVRYLVRREEWSLSGPDAWTVTNTVCKQILTYDGKKRHSEFKLTYNPTWKRVEVLEASVSNAAGRVSRADEREMNEFDCSWAASAPRYPASRDLVVNLPSVEVGSVVRLKYVVTATNAPAPFYRTWFFDSREPADVLSVVFNGVERTVRPAAAVPDEPLQPDGSLWRDCETVSSNGFAEALRALRPAVDVRPVAFPDSAVRRPTPSEVRDWMAKNVRVAGPSLYELPLAQQLTDPEAVLKERYASRLDYVRTLCALMRGAGYDADVVFAWNDADLAEAERRRNLEERPRAALFSTSLCRVRTRRGGFLWWGWRDEEAFAGTENEYTPFGASRYAGSHYLDPADGRLGVVSASRPEYAPRFCETVRMSVRDNGSVDMDVEREFYGPSSGSFRKRYAEMLPEDRSRHFQAMLGEIAQSASATRELETDVASYPARLSFSAYVPDYAAAADDAMTLTVPPFGEIASGFTGSRRETPMMIPAAEAEVRTVTVAFPRGYAKVDRLPSPYVVCNPLDPSEKWYEFSSASEVSDGRAVVTLRRERFRRGATVLGPQHFATVKEWNRVASGKSARAIVVRRTGSR